MKRIVCLVIAIIMLMGVFASCDSSNGNDDNGGSSSKKAPSQSEMEQMFEQATNYEANAKFKSAITIYRELYEYGFEDPDFGHKGLDGAMHTREVRYLHQRILCSYYTMAISSLKSQLKDPNSLVIYSMSVDSQSPQGKITVEFDYGAKNSFGGMVRNTYTQTYTLSQSQKDDVYDMNKTHMDSVGCTKDDVGEYLAGNMHIYKQSQFDAIVNGTLDY